ncbi:hypothetical protein HPB48_004991 [Haemaphysalis longicornis]|uniref:Uncharacterized protein n=1 Tax=Haemaphysalis longicornis TaxID=44386 RepID=A0A9J6G4B2_HAELO|nr:hypothetical protein HPB48_004991 [Haemaphysalis longicornis]
MRSTVKQQQKKGGGGGGSVTLSEEPAGNIFSYHPGNTRDATPAACIEGFQIHGVARGARTAAQGNSEICTRSSDFFDPRDVLLAEFHKKAVTKIAIHSDILRPTHTVHDETRPNRSRSRGPAPRQATELFFTPQRSVDGPASSASRRRSSATGGNARQKIRRKKTRARQTRTQRGGNDDALTPDSARGLRRERRSRAGRRGGASGTLVFGGEAARPSSRRAARGPGRPVVCACPVEDRISIFGDELSCSVSPSVPPSSRRFWFLLRRRPCVHAVSCALFRKGEYLLDPVSHGGVARYDPRRYGCVLLGPQTSVEYADNLFAADGAGRISSQILSGARARRF